MAHFPSALRPPKVVRESACTLRSPFRLHYSLNSPHFQTSSINHRPSSIVHRPSSIAAQATAWNLQGEWRMENTSVLVALVHVLCSAHSCHPSIHPLYFLFISSLFPLYFLFNFLLIPCYSYQHIPCQPYPRHLAGSTLLVRRMHWTSKKPLLFIC